MRIKQEISGLSRKIPECGDNYKVMFNGHIYELHVSISHVSIKGRRNNELLRDVYGDAYLRFLDKLYGYPANRSGSWPNFRDGDYEALARVFDALESKGCVIIELPF